MIFCQLWYYQMNQSECFDYKEFLRMLPWFQLLGLELPLVGSWTVPWIIPGGTAHTDCEQSHPWRWVVKPHWKGCIMCHHSSASLILQHQRKRTGNQERGRDYWRWLYIEPINRLLFWSRVPVHSPWSTCGYSHRVSVWTPWHLNSLKLQGLCVSVRGIRKKAALCCVIMFYWISRVAWPSS